MKKIKYLNQTLILLPVIVLASFVYISSPSLVVESYFNLFAEVSFVFMCVFLMFKIEEIRSTIKIYSLLLISTSILIVSGTIDVLDEFSEISSFMELIEDTLEPIGLLLFISSCFQWVNYHKIQFNLVKGLADIDELTGLYNRRAFIQYSNSYFDAFDNNLHQASLLVIDADHFKKINDNYGHQFGDEVLANIASTIENVLRKEDFVARIGGEEFVVILKDTSKEQALSVAEKILTSVQALNLTTNDKQASCTVSIGISSTNKLNANFDELFKQADEAMYEAKKSGRNCFYLYKK